MTDKKEWLFVKFSNGYTYKVSAPVIAKNRAKYYAGREMENKEQWQEIFDDELNFALTDTYELEDWATNNMNWSDVKEFAELVREKQIDYSREWVKAERWVE